MADEQNQELADEQNPEQEQEQATPEQQAAGQAQFMVQKIYVKDLSFELPNAPQVFQEAAQTEIKLNLSQRVNSVAENVYEVVLSITVTATSEEKTAYLAEVHQAGLFGIAGLDEQQKQAALNTLCPHTLFPYASRVVTDMVSDGGFPPLVLQPVNFEQIYMQRLSQAQQEGGEMEVQGNA
jgi:preprotein translocase subunit SecB